MKYLRLFAAELLIKIANICGRLAMRLLPPSYTVDTEQIPVVLPPLLEPSTYQPTFLDYQCAAITERYGHVIIQANQTAYAIPQREQEGRC